MSFKDIVSGNRVILVAVFSKHFSVWKAVAFFLRLMQAESYGCDSRMPYWVNLLEKRALK
jgi:hypothetical protein